MGERARPRRHLGRPRPLYEPRPFRRRGGALALVGRSSRMRWTRILMLAGAALAASGSSRPVHSATPPADGYGVLVMAHGGGPEWNQTVLDAVAPLRSQAPVEVAFGMADACSLQEGVRKLEAQGVRNIGVVRL